MTFEERSVHTELGESSREAGGLSTITSGFEVPKVIDAEPLVDTTQIAEECKKEFWQRFNQGLDSDSREQQVTRLEERAREVLELRSLSVAHLADLGYFMELAPNDAAALLAELADKEILISPETVIEIQKSLIESKPEHAAFNMRILDTFLALQTEQYVSNNPDGTAAAPAKPKTILGQLDALVKSCITDKGNFLTQAKLDEYERIRVTTAGRGSSFGVYTRQLYSYEDAKSMKWRETRKLQNGVFDGKNPLTHQSMPLAEGYDVVYDHLQPINIIRSRTTGKYDRKERQLIKKSDEWLNDDYRAFYNPDIMVHTSSWNDSGVSNRIAKQWKVWEPCKADLLKEGAQNKIVFDLDRLPLYAMSPAIIGEIIGHNEQVLLQEIGQPKIPEIPFHSISKQLEAELGEPIDPVVMHCLLSYGLRQKLAHDHSFWLPKLTLAEQYRLIAGLSKHTSEEVKDFSTKLLLNFYQNDKKAALKALLITNDAEIFEGLFQLVRNSPEMIWEEDPWAGGSYAYQVNPQSEKARILLGHFLKLMKTTESVNDFVSSQLLDKVGNAKSLITHIQAEIKHQAASFLKQHLPSAIQNWDYLDVVNEKYQEFNEVASLLVGTLRAAQAAGEVIRPGDVKSLEPKIVSSTEIRNNPVLIDWMRKIYRGNYPVGPYEQGKYPQRFVDDLIEGFDDSLSNPDIRTDAHSPSTHWNLLYFEGKPVAFNRFNRHYDKEGNLQYKHFGAFNIDPAYAHAKIGEAFMEQTLAQEKFTGGARIFAECDPRSPITQKYIEHGFVAFAALDMA